MSTAAAPPPGSSTSAHPTEHGWMRVLPEILGYVGAALVASAALNLVAQSWETWSDLTRLLVLLGAIAVLAVPSVVITVVSGGRQGLARIPVRRRLVGLMLALVAPLVAVTGHQILTMSGITDTFERADPWALIPAGVAWLAAVAAAWVARGVLTTLAVAGMSAFVALTGIVLLQDRPVWVFPLVIAGAGALWLAFAPPVLPPKVLSEALGVAWVLQGLMPQAMLDTRVMDPDMPIPPDELAAAWWSRGLLLGFAVIALIVFARGGSWAWAVGGVIAAALGALAIAGSALGWITGLLVAGVVLMAVSGGLVLLRRAGVGTTSAPAR